MGTFASISGIGGGIVGQSLLTFKSLGNLPLSSAIGTSMVAVSATCAVGAYAYYSEMLQSEHPQPFDFGAASVLAACSTTCATFGLLLQKRIPPAVSRRFMAGVMFSAPVLMYVRQQKESAKVRVDPIPVELVSYSMPAAEHLAVVVDDLWMRLKSTESVEHLVEHVQHVWSLMRQHEVWPVEYAAAVGCATGFVAGAFGVGGGLLMTSMLSVHENASTKQAIGASLFAMLPTAVLSATTHVRRGNVVWAVLPLLLVGSATGAYMGSRFAVQHMTDEQQRLFFSVVILALGCRTLMKR
jgi:uncharacterized membrane protein YfcA